MKRIKLVVFFILGLFMLASCSSLNHESFPSGPQIEEPGSNPDGEVSSYLITYYENGLKVHQEKLESGKALPQVESTKAPMGKTFLGWSTSKDEYVPVDFDVMPEEEVNLYAYYQNVKYTITFVANITLPDGITTTNEYEYHDRLGEFVPSDLQEVIDAQTDYVFVGWFTDPEFENEFIEVSMPAENVTLYAKWQFSGIRFMNGLDVFYEVKDDEGALVQKPLQVPTKPGYDFVGWVDAAGNEVSFPLTVTDEVQFVYASFVAKNTITYKVEHYLENLNGTFVRQEVEELTGTTDTAVEALWKSFTGFTKDEDNENNVLKGIVNYNGTLVLKLYYTRNSYKVSFETNGGSQVEEVSYKYEQMVVAPSSPNKLGYTFAGWELNGESYSFTNMPANDIVLSAKWQVVEYTVTFVATELVGKVTYTVENKEITEPAVPAVEHFTGVWEDYELTTGNITVKAVYTPVTYTVTFKAEGETVATENYTVVNPTITNPAVPTKEHFTGVWESYLLVGGNITVNAIYTPVTYYVTFVGEEGEVAKLPYTVENKEVVNPAVPTKEHYTGVWESYTLTSGNVEVEAVYTPVTYYVTFVAEGAEVAKLPYTVENKAVVNPTVPTKEHYTGVWESYTLTSGNVEVEAVYTPVTYYVTFVGEEGEVAKLPYTVENKEITEPSVPTKSHYTVAWESYTIESGNIIVNAVYTPVTYTVTFKDSDSVIGSDTYTIVDTNITEPAIPTKAHYTSAWATYVLDGGNKEVQVVYTPVTYYVTFVGEEGEVAKLPYTVENKAVVEPAVPTKEHYSAAWESYTIESGNITVNAVYTAVTYYVTFVADGSEVAKLPYTIVNNTVVEPAVPTKAGYTGSWFTYELNGGNKEVQAVYEVVDYTINYNTNDGALVMDAIIADFLNDYNTARGKSHTVESFVALGSWGEISDASLFLYNAQYKAKWSWLVKYIASVASSANKPAYDVFFDFNSQSELNAANSNHIYRIAYELRGWVGQTQYTKNANFKTADYSTRSVQLKAFEYYYSNSYNIESETINLYNLYKPGHTFEGWYNNPEFTGTAITSIPSGSYGDINLYAKFVELPKYQLNMNVNEGKLDDSYYGVYSIGDPQVLLDISTYDNTGNASGTYLCDTSIVSKNSLRWQYKILLQYDATLDAYKVVCLDAAKASANNAASAAGVTWTHALSSSSSNITTLVTLGQYIVLSQKVTVGTNGFEAFVYEQPQLIYGVKPIIYTIESEYITLPTPTKEGYTFAGWYNNPEFTGEKVTVVDTAINSNVTVYAKWTPNTYTITFNTDGGNDIESISAPYGTAIVVPATPTKVGYTFAGWDQEVPSTMPLNGLTLTAKWTVNKYTISFDTNGGSVVDSITADYNSEIVAPAAPTKVGYTFAGWDQEFPSTMPLNGLTLTAKWTPIEYTIVFNTNDGTEVQSITVGYGLPVIAPAAPTKVGYTFAGWDQEIPSTMPLNGLTINAKWDIINYTINYELGGGTNHTSNPTTYNIESIIELQAATKEFFSFGGWELNGNPITKIEGLYGDITLTAVWYTAMYTISYDLAGGDWALEVGKTTYSVDETYVLPIPKMTGYTFLGWSDGTNIVTEVSGQNYNLTATWQIKEVTITFDTDGGTVISPITQNYNTAIVEPAAPTKVGYTFAGWDQEIPANMPADDMIITALWTINKYTITFDTDGGSEIPSITEDYNSVIIAPANPTKVGYTFAGWDQEIPSTIPAENVTIKALWIINKYTITFDTDGGSEIPSITEDYNSAIAAPENPIKLGYTFAGWDQEIPSIMPAENVTVKAIWTLSIYTITYNVDESLSDLLDVNSIIQDFLNDYNTARGKSHTVDTFIALGSWGEISDASLFLYNATYKAKWAWLVNYIASVASSANKAAYQNFFNYNSQAELNAANSNYIYSIAYELRGWVGQNQYTKNSGFVTADYSQASVQNKLYDHMNTLFPTEFNINSSEIKLYSLAKNGYTFGGWYNNPEFTGEPIVSVSPSSLENINLYAKFDIIPYNIELETNDGKLDDSYYATITTGTSIKEISLGKYDNTGNASNIYFCDKNITVNNSLRWQYKILLKYDESVKAYEVVCLDAAKDSANNAATAAGVTWTHALSSSSSNITTLVTLGQYIVLSQDVSVGATNFSASVYDASQVSLGIKPIHYTSSSEDFFLPEPTKSNYYFVGWYNNPELTGTPISLIQQGTTGDMKLFAKWISTEGLTKLTLTDSEKQSLSNLGVTPDVIVNTELTASKYLINYNEYTLGTTCFASLADAVANANEGDVIYVFAGTYSTALTISTANITIAGPNYGLSYDESRFDEAVINNSISVGANGFVLDGVSFSGSGKNIKGTAAISDLVIRNNIITASGAALNGGRTAIVGSDYNINGFTFENNSLVCNASAGRNAIAAYGTLTNTKIVNNYISNGATKAYANEIIRLQKIAGTFTFDNNECLWATSNMGIFVGSSSNSCTTLSISNNIIKGASTGGCTTIGVNRLSASAVLTIANNKLDYFDKGNTLSFTNAKSGSVVNINNNEFGSNVAFKLTAVASANVKFTNNTYNGGISADTAVTPSDYNA